VISLTHSVPISLCFLFWSVTWCGTAASKLVLLVKWDPKKTAMKRVLVTESKHALLCCVTVCVSLSLLYVSSCHVAFPIISQMMWCGCGCTVTNSVVVGARCIPYHWSIGNAKCLCQARQRRTRTTNCCVSHVKAGRKTQSSLARSARGCFDSVWLGSLW